MSDQSDGATTDSNGTQSEKRGADGHEALEHKRTLIPCSFESQLREEPEDDDAQDTCEGNSKQKTNRDFIDGRNRAGNFED
jgi:hypothetical protein